MNPYDKAHELARSLRASDPYGRLKAAREKVEADPSTQRMLQDFRRRQWLMQTQQMMGQQPSEEERSMLEKLSEVITLNQDARAYLEAEYQVTQVAMDVQRILSEVVEEAMLPAPLEDTGGDEP